MHRLHVEHLAPTWRHCFRRLRNVEDMGPRLPRLGLEDDLLPWVMSQCVCFPTHYMYSLPG